MPFLIAPDGVRLRYALKGEGPDLLLHVGSGCDSELWQAAGYLEPLAHSYRCILLDHRGHGGSDRPRGVDANRIERYAADVIALLDELEVDRCAFWGYSAGIDVGLKVADDHPARIWALIGSGSFSHSSPEEIAAFVARRSAEFRAHGWEKLLERFDVQERDPVPEWMKDRIRATDVQQYIDHLEGLPTSDWDDWDALSRVTAPTLFLTGELEDPNDGTAEAAARMANGRRIRLAGLGHINAFLRSDLALPHALDFLSQQPASVRLSTLAE